MSLFRGEYRVESIRLSRWDYANAGWYFVTICTHNRAGVFGNVVNGKTVCVDRFVVMPNHVHAIMVIGNQHLYWPDLSQKRAPELDNASTRLSPKPGSLSTIVRSYKSGVTRRCRKENSLDFSWQPGYYDHVIRTRTSLSAIRDYIEVNPRNWRDDPENSL